MSTWINYAMCFVAGALMAGLFIGGLRYTILTAMRTKHVLLFPLSFLARSGATLVTFYWISNHEPLRLGLSLAGFMVGRSMFVGVASKRNNSPR